MAMEVCPKCKSTEIDCGWILSAGKVAFKSDSMKYPMQGGNVRTFVCTSCGYIESFVDRAYLDRIVAAGAS